MIILIITRILDLITTLLNTNKWGWDVECNPLMYEVGKRGLIIPYQILILVVIISIAELIPKYRKTIYVSMSTISLVVATSNLLCYLLIR